MIWWIAAIVIVVLGVLAVAVYLGLVTGAVPIDVNWRRRTRPLGPQIVPIAAPRELVFAIISAPYLARQPHALAEKIQVIERGATMVLAAHRTPVRRRLVAKTVETVRFTEPKRVDFRLVRGPVPHVVEEFVLEETDGGTRLTYRGEIGDDFGRLGQWWAGRVAAKWEQAVASSLATVKEEAERRS